MSLVSYNWNSEIHFDELLYAFISNKRIITAIPNECDFLGCNAYTCVCPDIDVFLWMFSCHLNDGLLYYYLTHKLCWCCQFSFPIDGHNEAEFGMSWCAGFGGSFYSSYFKVILIFILNKNLKLNKAYHTFLINCIFFFIIHFFFFYWLTYNLVCLSR